MYQANCRATRDTLEEYKRTTLQLKGYFPKRLLSKSNILEVTETDQKRLGFILQEN